MTTTTPTTTTPTPTRKPAPARIPVECMECGKKFTTRSTLPECPRCHGVDVDIR